MKIRIGTYRLILTLWLLWGCVASPLWAYPQTNQPSAWRTTPVMSNDRMPSYQFHSTSTYAPTVGSSVYSSTVYCPGASTPMQIGRRKDQANPYPWDEYNPDDDHPVGETDDPAPIGSPFILLILAALYLAFKRLLPRVTRLQ